MKDNILKEIENLRDRLAELERRAASDTPEKGDTYWFIKNTGKCDAYVWQCDEIDWELLKAANCFPTKEAATTAMLRLSSARKQIRAGLLADPNAGSFVEATRSWTAWCRKGFWEPVQLSRLSSYPIYVHTYEQAEEMARRLNTEGV